MNPEGKFSTRSSTIHLVMCGLTVLFVLARAVLQLPFWVITLPVAALLCWYVVCILMVVVLGIRLAKDLEDDE